MTSNGGRAPFNIIPGKAEVEPGPWGYGFLLLLDNIGRIHQHQSCWVVHYWVRAGSGVFTSEPDEGLGTALQRLYREVLEADDDRR